MCTLDPMGYTTAQYMVVPFLVLQAALKQAVEEKGEVHQINLGLIQTTCTNMLTVNQNLRNTILREFNNFANKPQSRTADVIPSIQVLTSQLLAFNNLEADLQKIKYPADSGKEGYELEYDAGLLPEYFRFAAEEVMRRMQQKDAQPIGKSNIIKK